ncbi:hypothetical protein M413DRAFT_176325 [Hebeloma cylindrosporum]|uniref:Uncharacterized protein n=1 Tax=Hebeloma cylindrosporum TaxID=76867 RepID=A0A0C3C7U6_HEBCY|nr:hypothetical protein M413DRAFT_176325 [Hebeloma cylindrosporum h7]
MPRAKKGGSTRYSRDTLEQLTRTQIQQIAKTQGVKANGKTAAIINELLSRQSPRRLGTPETDIIHVEEDGIAHKLIPEVEVIKEEPVAVSPSRLEQGPVQMTVNTPGNNPLTSSNRRCTPYPPRRRSSYTTGSSSDSGPSRPPTPPHVPFQTNEQHVRIARRQLKRWNDERVALEDELAEHSNALQYALQELKEGQTEIHERGWRRAIIEKNIVARMKEVRPYWDGTPFMKKPEQEKWKAFVAENWEPSIQKFLGRLEEDSVASTISGEDEAVGFEIEGDEGDEHDGDEHGEIVL